MIDIAKQGIVRRVGIAQINRASVQYRGLKYCWPLIGPRYPDLVNGATLTATGTIGTAAGLHGVVPSSAGATNYLAATLATPADGDNISVFCRVRVTTVDSAFRAVWRFSGNDKGCYQWNDNTWQFLNISAMGSVGTVTAGTWVDLLITSSGTGSVMYRDGVERVTGGIFAVPGSPEIRIFGDEFSQHIVGQITDFRIYNRTLSAQEAWMLSDPQTQWELYRLPARRIWLDAFAAAPGGATWPGYISPYGWQ
jgi:hypothetical protein